MKCVVWRHGETKPNKMTAVFEKTHTTLIVKEVPAEVRDNCGEEYLSQAISQQLLKQVSSAVTAGIELDIRNYKSAA